MSAPELFNRGIPKEFVGSFVEKMVNQKKHITVNSEFVGSKYGNRLRLDDSCSDDPIACHVSDSVDSFLSYKKSNVVGCRDSKQNRVVWESLAMAHNCVVVFNDSK
jgi:hypothetical protein